jgi:hypothetical protein
MDFDPMTKKLWDRKWSNFWQQPDQLVVKQQAYQPLR